MYCSVDLGVGTGGGAGTKKSVTTEWVHAKANPLIRRQDMQPQFQSRQEVIIDAPLEEVWSFCMDLTKIPQIPSSSGQG